MDTSRSSEHHQRALNPNWRQRSVPWVLTGLLAVGVLVASITSLSSARFTRAGSVVSLESLLITPQDLGPGWSTQGPTEYQSYKNLFSDATKCHLRSITGTGAERTLDSLRDSLVFQEAVFWTPNASQTFSVIKQATTSGCFTLSVYSSSLSGPPHREVVTPLPARQLGSLPEIVSAWRVEGNPIRYEEEYYVFADNYVIRMTYSGLKLSTKEVTIALGIL
jgi:hypothetical protein